METSARTAHAQLVGPRTSEKSGPGGSPGSRAHTIRLSSSTTNKVCRCSSGVLMRFHSTRNVTRRRFAVRERLTTFETSPPNVSWRMNGSSMKAQAHRDVMKASRRVSIRQDRLSTNEDACTFRAPSRSRDRLHRGDHPTDAAQYAEFRTPVGYGIGASPRAWLIRLPSSSFSRLAVPSGSRP